MKLSEALRYGITLRPESHRERFVNVEGLGLCSDAWGAAVEAVMPTVAQFNWTLKDPIKFERAMEAFRAVQMHYFRHYRQMPAKCPGAKQHLVQSKAHIVSGSFRDEPEMKVDEQKVTNLGGVTSECDRVEHMYGMVDHLFYAHGWSREKVAEVVEWYEKTASNAALFVNFKHYQISGQRTRSV
jgi:hypothetical protein